MIFVPFSAKMPALDASYKTITGPPRPKNYPSNWVWPPMPVPPPPRSPPPLFDPSVNDDSRRSDSILEYEGQCKHCEETFNSKDRLISHILSNHSNKENSETDNTDKIGEISKPSDAFEVEDQIEKAPTKMKADVDEISDEDDDPFHCPHCSCKYSLQSWLDEHVKNFHKSSHEQESRASFGQDKPL